MSEAYPHKKLIRSLLCYSLCSAAVPLYSTVTMVTNTNDSGTGSLRAAITATNGGASGDSIQFTVGGTITLASPLPPIFQTNVTMLTEGNIVVLNGASTFSGLVIWPTAGNFLLDNTTGGSGSFTSLDTASVGGSGGRNAGGGLGAGGGVLVGANTTVSIQGITFNGCKAIGGPGGAPPAAGEQGGGGGMSGGTGGTGNGGGAGGGGGGGFAGLGGGTTGGTATGAGGGGGINFSGGNALTGNSQGGGGGSDRGNGGDSAVLNGGAGSTGSQGSGGAGGTIVSVDGVGGTGSSGGGGGYFNAGISAVLGGPGGPILGGGGGTAPMSAASSAPGGGGVGGGGGGIVGNGGAGGFAGGGGAGGIEGSFTSAGTGGMGGFGGGGGSGSTAGAGGFGGGGGGIAVPGGIAGTSAFGGGSGGALPGGGGGGAGLGGAIFIDQGATLIITGSLTTTGSGVSGGAEGSVTAGAGIPLGTDFFIRETGTLEFGITSPYTASNAIESDVGTGAGGGSGGILMSGSSILTLAAPNFFTGFLEFNNGIVQISTDNQLGINQAATPLNNILLFTGGTLEITANSFTVSASRATTINGSGTIQTDSGVTTQWAPQITGGGGLLIKSGPGTLFLNNNTNNYSGGTNFTAGTVQINNPGDLGSGGTLTFSNAATLEFLNAFGAATLTPPIALSGSGVGSGGTFLVDGSSSPTLTGQITGTGNLNKDGAGTLILNPPGMNNIYSGITNILNGRLAAGAATTLSPDSVVNFANVAGAMLDTSAGNNTIAGLEGGGSTGGAVVLGASTLTLDVTSVLSAFSGGITGTGGITKTGPDAQVLAGAGLSTYNGLTTINAGTLAAGAVNSLSPNSVVNFANVAGAVLDTSAGNNTIAGLEGGGSTGGAVVLGASTLTLDVTSVLSAFLGGITGAGGITKTGPDAQVLAGAGLNTYGGPTFINTGTLAAGAVNALSPNSEVILANAAATNLDLSGGNNIIAGLAAGGSTGGNVILGNNILTFGGDNITTAYAGSISGGASSGINKVGTGTIFLIGNDTFTGTATVTAGTMQIEQFQAIATTGAIVDNGTFIFNHSGTGTYAANITGTGTLIQQNPAGTLDLTGTNNVGPFLVNAGTAIINGMTTTTQTTIAAGSLLRGIGTLVGNPITNFGTVFPGNSIGTLTFIGPYIQATGSTLEIEVSPQNGVADLLNIIGPMTIQPNATLLLVADPGMYDLDNVYQIVATTGGVFGIFDNTVQNFPTVQFGVFYRNNGIFLEVLASGFSMLGCVGNAGALTTYLDKTVITPGSDLGVVVGILRTLTLAEICAALGQFDPSAYKGLSVAQQENVFRVAKGITHHLLDDLLNTRCRRYSACGTRKKEDRKSPSCEKVNDREKRFDLWADVFGDWSHQRSQHGHLGYHSKGGGGMLGMDYFFTNQFNLGLAGAYSYSDVHTSESRAEGHINSYYGALYGLLHSRHAFIDVAVIAGYDQFDASRKIKFSSSSLGTGINRRAHTDHNGWDIDGHMDGGFIIDQWKEVEFRPFISLDYSFMHEDSFTEHGAKSLNLKVRDSDYTMLRSEVGLTMARCFKTKYSDWIPELRFSVIRENRFNGKHFRATLVDQDGSFRGSGLYPNRTLYSPGAGLTSAFYDGKLSASIYYDGEFGDRYLDHMGSFEFSWLF